MSKPATMDKYLTINKTETINKEIDKNLHFYPCIIPVSIKQILTGGNANNYMKGNIIHVIGLVQDIQTADEYHQILVDDATSSFWFAFYGKLPNNITLSN